jgi:hypothetical protein
LELKEKKKRGPKKGEGQRTGFDKIKSILEDQSKKVEVVAEDLFKPIQHKKITRGAHRAPKDAIRIELGGVDKIAHDAQILRLEWAIKYPTMSPREFLQDVKGYSFSQIRLILEKTGTAEEWNREKNAVLDRMTESVVKRHIDIIAEVQETHIKASKVGLAKAIEFLSKLSVEPAKDSDGRMIMDGNGRPVWKGYRSIDLMNIMSSIEKAQVIYRRAMGLGNDEGGMAQILEKIGQLNVQQNVQENHLHIHEAPQSELGQKIEKEMSYDDLLEFIEFRREQKKKQEESTG